MTQDPPSEISLFVAEHPTTVVAELWRLMNEAPAQGRYADFDLIAENLLRVILCDEVPEPVQAAARDLCQAYAAQALRCAMPNAVIPIKPLH